MKRFTTYRQLDAMDCGPTCLKMIFKHYGKSRSLDSLKRESQIGKSGVSLLGLSEAAEKFGLRTMSARVSFKQLLEDAPLPCILHWQQNHFVVLTPGANTKKLTIADPARGLVTYRKEEFLSQWIYQQNSQDAKGIVLLMTPSANFYSQDDENISTLSWDLIRRYLSNYKFYLFQIFLGVLIASILQLIFPFLAQSIVDTGISTHNLNFIQIILIAQSTLFFCRTVVEFIRSRILLYISSHINLFILSDFWMKLLRLPMQFFDTKHSGDIIQRINDHHRIEEFITGTILQTLFSTINLLVFSVVLLTYNTTVFIVFVAGTVSYFLWIIIFLKYRRNLDFKRFAVASKENSIVMQLIQGMHEIKLQNAEFVKRWEWERVQAKLFKLNFKSLSLSQYQQAGAFFINEGKNIVVTYLVAKSVIDGQLSLGTMVAVQYIIGQLNAPVEQLILFVQKAQDAKFSLERLNEIQGLEEEESGNKQFLNSLPSNLTISFNNFSFKYAGAGNHDILKDINLQIPAGKITAIVGMSGSGKTTILKILLRYYNTYGGYLKVGDMNLESISPRYWRMKCGTVMQDSYIFNDSIANNIAIGDKEADEAKLLHACKVANILTFIESLPLGFNTMIGAEGHGLSAGQKQRILIARVVYKNPTYIFLDEATNALDSHNEKIIMENLIEFFHERTVVIVAHRLSTVKNADHIIVLENGEIIETGNHLGLVKSQGRYFELVKNQLELGN